MLQVYKLKPNAHIPTKVRETDACFDLYALNDVFIPIGTTAKIETGIAIFIPEGSFGKIFDRSSMASRGLIISGGVIDSQFSGSCDIIMNNFSCDREINNQGRLGYNIKAGDKIAQIVLLPCEVVKEVFELKTLWKSDRGDGGFGSTGV